ncbi:MAG: ribosomal protein S18-alanine N-acetyltransferase [Endomicrobiales bacterium]|nr:ribosomal protein S18-alanine N-acetyltransferase [Endomicrobiales bacterium]
MELIFSPLKEAHLDQIMDIERVSFPVPWTRGMFERELALAISRFFAVMSGDRVIGYAGYWQIEDEAHLVNLAVHPDFRKQGVGKRTLEFIMEESRKAGLSKILLEVRESNLPARKMYGSLGFKNSGTRPDYYITEDAVLMEYAIQ